MQFAISAAAAAALFSAIASAANTQNPIHAPMEHEVVPACKEYILKWTPTTEGRVDILLRKGPSDNLGSVGPITIAVPNSGVFFWKVPCDLESGDNYAIEIKAPNDEINYTGLFSIENKGESEPESKPESKPGKAGTYGQSKEEEEEEEDAPTTTSEAAESTTTTAATSTAAQSTASSTGVPTYHNGTAPIPPHSNSTTPGNSTHSPTKTPTSPSSGSDEDEPEKTKPAEADSMAATLKSSLALSVTVLGAVFYLL